MKSEIKMTKRQIPKIDFLLMPYIQWYNKEDEYFLNVPKTGKISSSICFLNQMCEGVVEQTLPKEIIYGKEVEPTRFLIPKKELRQYFPDNLNNQRLWRKMHQYYKCLPICGQPVKNALEASKINMQRMYNEGVVDMLDKILRSKCRSKMLEIGYGYGNISIYVNTEHKNTEYYGIDLIRRFDAVPNLFETDGYNIPKEIPNKLDLVFSYNTFQHLSQRQRFNYIRKSHELLKRGGKMFFTSFIMTEENKNSGVFGLIDETGRGYCRHFSQPTEVDYDHELKSLFNEIGFKIIKWDIQINHLDCIIVKK